MFDDVSHSDSRLAISPPGAQPQTASARLIPVIAHPTGHPGRRLALELLARAAAVALAATVILGLLPEMARAVW
jgi:hypothetical protein